MISPGIPGGINILNSSHAIHLSRSIVLYPDPGNAFIHSRKICHWQLPLGWPGGHLSVNSIRNMLIYLPRSRHSSRGTICIKPAQPPASPQRFGGRNVFVEIAQCISPNCKMYFSKFQNVFLQRAKCVCSKLQNIHKACLLVPSRSLRQPRRFQLVPGCILTDCLTVQARR